jgi:endonuclease/exonuclease/phosphatase (EEP) superfamily protein YafD
VIRSEVLDDVGDAVRPLKRRWPFAAVSVCTWSYVAAVLVVWLLLRLGGDRWWFATVILFGPRWLCVVPLAVLVPAAGLIRRRLLWVLGAAALVVFGPVMGFCIPWARLMAAGGPSLRILTCNVKGKCNNNRALDELIRTALPDIVALQDCWGELQIRWPAGWHVWKKGTLVVASRYPLRHDGADHRWQRPGHGPRADMLDCTVQVPGRDIDFYSVHLQSPHEGLSAVLNRQTVLRPSNSAAVATEINERWRESEDAQRSVSGFSAAPILAGDFNLPADSAIYRRYWSEYRDAFSGAGLGFGYTEWPQMRWISFGIRIDHILTGPGWQCRRCWVGPDVGSDHLPLLAELSLAPVD